MAKVDDFNTITPEYSPAHREVYHDQSACKFGRAIKPEHRLPGKGGKKYCSECKKLN